MVGPLAGPRPVVAGLQPVVGPVGPRLEAAEAVPRPEEAAAGRPCLVMGPVGPRPEVAEAGLWPEAAAGGLAAAAVAQMMALPHLQSALISESSQESGHTVLGLSIESALFRSYRVADGYRHSNHTK